MWVTSPTLRAGRSSLPRVHSPAVCVLLRFPPSSPAPRNTHLRLRFLGVVRSGHAPVTHLDQATGQLLIENARPALAPTSPRKPSVPDRVHVVGDPAVREVPNDSSMAHRPISLVQSLVGSRPRRIQGNRAATRGYVADERAANQTPELPGSVPIRASPFHPKSYGPPTKRPGPHRIPCARAGYGSMHAPACGPRLSAPPSRASSRTCAGSSIRSWRCSDTQNPRPP